MRELERCSRRCAIEGIAIDELALAETDLEQVFLRIMAGTETTDDARPVVTVPEALMKLPSAPAGSRCSTRSCCASGR